nr:integrase, catalytic region, zinc finger, CCHC-type, peptidase aspartic, catalytic [Tanacetum cinerariifolium]
MRILSVIGIKTFERYGYAYLGEIVIRRVDYNEYKISEADFKNMHPNDSEDMYLLHLQGKLNHLPGSEKVHLYNAINFKPRAVIYKDRNDQKKMPIETEVHKFSDGTLTRVLHKLGHIVKDFRLFKYNLGMENRICLRMIKGGVKSLRDLPRCINYPIQQVHNIEESPSTSLIIVEEQVAPPIVFTSEEQTSLILLNNADEFNHEDFVDFDGNTVFIPYDALKFEEAESSTIALDLSNMHEFHQIESIQDELHQFERLEVLELVLRPDGKNITAVKWIWKNKNDADNIVIRNKYRLVAKGHKQEEGINFEESFALSS